MSEKELLSRINGFAEALASKEKLANSGTDFLEQKGNVHRAVSKLHPKRLTLKVTEIFEDTPSTHTIRVEDSRGQELPPFQAGQYINVFVDINGVKTARPYAMASSPAQRHFYDLTVKKAEGGFVSHYLVDQVKIGQTLTSTGPMGTFYHNPVYHGSDLVFFAGGSGSVPARSMLLDILERELPFSFHMIYSNSYVDDVIYACELRELARLHDNFTLTEIITRPPEGYDGLGGRLNKARLIDLIDDDEEGLARKMYYICGPTPFNENCVELLSSLGVPTRRMRVEANGAPKRPDLQKDWPGGLSSDAEVTVTVKGKGSFVAQCGEPLLNSLERNGFSTENACRSGECSLCRVRVLKGKTFNADEMHLRKSDEHFGWVYSCVAYPTEDIEIDI